MERCKEEIRIHADPNYTAKKIQKIARGYITRRELSRYLEDDDDENTSTFLSDLSTLPTGEVGNELDLYYMPRRGRPKKLETRNIEISGLVKDAIKKARDKPDVEDFTKHLREYNKSFWFYFIYYGICYITFTSTG